MPNSYRRKSLKPTGQVGIVYLLHFSEPYKGARHYVGFTGRYILDRVAEHQAGYGSSLTGTASACGIQFALVRMWVGVDAVLEYIIKARAESPKLCPFCNPDAYRYARYPEFILQEGIPIELGDPVNEEAIHEAQTQARCVF